MDIKQLIETIVSESSHFEMGTIFRIMLVSPITNEHQRPITDAIGKVIDSWSYRSPY